MSSGHIYPIYFTFEEFSRDNYISARGWHDQLIDGIRPPVKPWKGQSVLFHVT